MKTYKIRDLNFLTLQCIFALFLSTSFLFGYSARTPNESKLLHITANNYRLRTVHHNSIKFVKAFDDERLGIDIDGEGNIYIVGITTSTNFPITNNAQQKNFGGVADAFVMKINPKLQGQDSIIYATYLGGSQSDFGLGIEVDKDGAAYVTGRTNSKGFPITLC